MSYPSLEQYQEALQHPIVLTDPELKTGSVTTTGLGLPLALCGGFALTYTLSTRTRKFAVRCFHKESPALERRYQAISKKLQQLHSPYFLDFEFQPNGIRINQHAYPVVKMTWANGETLGSFLESRRHDKGALQNLINSMKALASYLEREGIAHGDVQTGNLMVSGNGSTLQLIDYDGMYVDEIQSLGSSEMGHRNFQHPERPRTRPFDATLDRFSFIELNCALRALEADPSLWDKTRSDGDGVLFRANDFDDPQSSAVFSLLYGKTAFSQDASRFASICKAPLARIPTLDDFLSGRNIPHEVIKISTTPALQKVRVYISAYPVLDAKDFDLCMRHVGDRVELIGQIVEVKESRTRHGKPYVFINFGPWQGQIVKISVWSEGLAALHPKPSQSWVGKHISVVGLMEPPYASKRYRYSHLAISITQNQQISFISAEEAAFRLGSSGSTGRAIVDNAGVLDKIAGRNPLRKPSPIRSFKPASQNQAILAKLRQAQGIPPQTIPYPPTPSPSRPGQQKSKGVIGKILDWLFR